ncbi:hypothetical protein P872_15660 [Rhodonellum psychrophilum GCM71 = DSM 17998]|uniref:Uncharacterized protein n=1 Tax=Rhodonellum psychrophilum GCM71 = DSM 17998 TaxID=1123057 RepID=U5C2C8_9BACT|nr:hypothetical protein P872_15660 [Rhodonellum psychrophilum GCM71 = DSM 17998]
MEDGRLETEDWKREIGDEFGMTELLNKGLYMEKVVFSF